MNIQYFEPINSTEKVDEIICALCERNLVINGGDIENIVNQYIRKVKIQFYFKEEFFKRKDEILPVYGNGKSVEHFKRRTNKIDSHNLITKTQVKETTIASQKKVKHNHKRIIGKSVKGVSELIGQSESTIHNLLVKRDDRLKDIDSDTLFDDFMSDLISDFIANALKVKNRRERKIKPTSVNSYQKLSEKMKPTFGKEGNYGKLIYIRSK